VQGQRSSCTQSPCKEKRGRAAKRVTALPGKREGERGAAARPESLKT